MRVKGESMQILSQNVLVLNRLWQAVNVCSVRRAMCLLFQGHAQVVHEDEGNFSTLSFHNWRDYSSNGIPGDYLHTPYYKILAPEVILLGVFDRLPFKEVKLTRHNIFERDKNICQYCGKKFDRKELNIDHVVPRDMGGSTSWANLVCSCKRCNSRKANNTPKMAGMALIRKPKKPKWHPYLGYNFEKKYNSLWRHFIDVSLWKEQDEAVIHTERVEELALSS